MTNYGNTCYFNAAVQCLVYVPNMSNYFLQHAEVGDLNGRRKGARGLAAAYAEFVRAYWTTGAPADPADASDLYRAFMTACRGFPQDCEHDAHEALLCVLDKLHDGLSRMKPGDCGVSRHPRVCAEAWTAGLKGETSVVSEVFRGQIEQCVTGVPGVSHDHFTCLSLGVHDSSCLAACMHKFMAPEMLEDGTGICRRFTYLPRVLAVHFKRFDGSGQKIDKFVDYPFELDLSAYVAGEEVEHHYQLFSVCLHRGTADSGHYVTCGEVKGNWFTCDDSNATPLRDINDVIQRDAYVLLYRRL